MVARRIHSLVLGSMQELCRRRGNSAACIVELVQSKEITGEAGIELSFQRLRSCLERRSTLTWRVFLLEERSSSDFERRLSS